MFKYFNQFVDAERNSLDVLICDEAHRIRETSANRYTPASFRSGRPQVAELIDAARVPVFLLDEHQVVRPGEIGTIDDIRAAAHAVGLETQVIELDAQFRCGGSRAYEQWVLRLLGLEPGGPIPWEGDEQLHALDDSRTKRDGAAAATGLLDEGYGARMAAGYCWPWSDPVPGGGLKPDVVNRRLAQALEQQEGHLPRWRPGNAITGQATMLASSKSAACTPRRASSTTTPA